MDPRQASHGKDPPPTYRECYQQDVSQTAQEEPQEQENEHDCDTYGNQGVCLNLRGIGNSNDRSPTEADGERRFEE